MTPPSTAGVDVERAAVPIVRCHNTVPVAKSCARKIDFQSIQYTVEPMTIGLLTALTSCSVHFERRRATLDGVRMVSSGLAKVLLKPRPYVGQSADSLGSGSSMQHCTALDWLPIGPRRLKRTASAMV